MDSACTGRGGPFADAIEGVRWRRGAGEARLSGGITAPVSRACAGALKQAGWP